MPMMILDDGTVIDDQVARHVVMERTRLAQEFDRWWERDGIDFSPLAELRPIAKAAFIAGALTHARR